MSVINSQPLIGASGNQGGAYNIERSLRFRSSASAYLSRTPASAGNRNTWTFSTWVKRGKLDSSRQYIFSSTSGGASDAGFFLFNFAPNEVIEVSGFSTAYMTTTQSFRDPSAWYHLVLTLDTTQATSSNRLKLYVNGSQVTSFSTINYPTLNQDTGINGAWLHNIGALGGLDCYLTETNFIDGQALTPSSFGETDTITGVWKPKRYAGTYGTNGFYLKFNNLTSTSTLGNDSSGNSNTWTVNNVSLTAGATYDSMTDVPTLTSATAANYCVLNPLKTHLSPTISNGNLQSSSMSGGATVWGTMAVATGKWYFEATVTAAGSPSVGIIDANRGASEQIGSTASGSAAYLSDGRIRINSSTSGTYSSYTTNDVIGVAFDCDAPSVSFYKNNTLQATVTPTSGITYSPQFIDWNAGTSGFAANFGQRPFAYTPPSGFVALNTFNLPESTIVAGNKVMDATLYTGNNSTQSITNAGGFSPDLVWLKQRSAGTTFHLLYDTNRGAGKYLASNSTVAEGTISQSLTAFNSNGFSVGADPDGASNTGWNASGASMVAWQWRGSDSAAVTNTAGSITSTVSANPSAGFSIVTYTGTGANATVGHGLGVAPQFIIIKCRNTGSTSWVIGHTSIGWTNYLLFDTSAIGTSPNVWQNTAPSSSVMSLGTSNAVNASGSTYVAYCWSEIAGFSKFGTFTGNGSADGTFVYTGFRPKFLLIKTNAEAGDWQLWDSSRGSFNVNGADLLPNSSAAEVTVNAFDFLSNGFKMRVAASPSYIYAAFAENPFKNSLAR